MQNRIRVCEANGMNQAVKYKVALSFCAIAQLHLIIAVSVDHEAEPS